MPGRINSAEGNFLKAANVNYILLNFARKICIFCYFVFPSVFNLFFLCMLVEKTNHSLAHIMT
jgi:hypothetical protein